MLKQKALRAAAPRLVGILVAMAACAPDYSNGSRAGVVTKLSYKGLIWKSWEGEMVMGGMRQSADGAIANVFAFNVDPSAVAKVQAAQRSGHPVELVYRQWAMAPPSIENGYVVIEVRDVDASKARDQ